MASLGNERVGAIGVRAAHQLPDRFAVADRIAADRRLRRGNPDVPPSWRLSTAAGPAAVTVAAPDRRVDDVGKAIAFLV